MNGVVPL